MTSEDVANASLPELLRLYVNVLHELVRREFVRSTNNPVADLSEYLVVKALGLTRVKKSTKGFDATDDKTGMKYEIKARRATSHNPSRMLSAIRDIEARHFDYLVGVLFSETFDLSKACIVPFETVRSLSKHRPHVNAAIFELKDSVWSLPGVTDITDKIRAVFERLEG